MIEAVGTILRARGHHILTARDSLQALAWLEKQDFDLVVADLQVSEGSNGIAFGEWLALHKPALARKLIWICAVVPSGAVNRKIAGNICPILQKPFKSNDLLAAVDELLLRDAHPAPVEH